MDYFYIFQLSELSFAPGVERGTGDARLAADFRYRRTRLSLLQGKDNLSLR